MTIARHLRLIDELRVREYPPEHAPSGSRSSGPGYHTAYLRGADEGGAAGEAASSESRAQVVAEQEALLDVLTRRWGEPDWVSLWSTRERMLRGEAIPEPWATSVVECQNLHLWKVDERWIALAFLGDKAVGSQCDVVVVVTSVDPP
ncbi:hypothetical protein [uncultured Streptomyces sp.]|uniref:hypothetical protein n=1 Tax=uncultured Streptomyces sp. TaxID=174707 RepID=UPI00261104D3|nr:hypothetical protein [uncultured Streptomyces sp.]